MSAQTLNRRRTAGRTGEQRLAGGFLMEKIRKDGGESRRRTQRSRWFVTGRRKTEKLLGSACGSTFFCSDSSAAPEIRAQLDPYAGRHRCYTQILQPFTAALSSNHPTDVLVKIGAETVSYLGLSQDMESVSRMQTGWLLFFFSAVISQYF